jgi:hypothetical protein
MIIVTGVGRSGTSAVAGVLHHSGISMGRELYEASEFNPTGYYEEAPVCQLNDRILAATAGAEHWSCASRQEVLAAAEPFAEEMRTLAAEAEGGWKDPRFSWTLEAWLPHLRERPRIVVCLRSPAAVVASTMRRYGQTEAKVERWLGRQWKLQYERLLEVIDDCGLGACCIEYDALLADRQAAIDRLSAFVGQPLDPGPVEPAHRHESGGVPRGYRTLYARVRKLGGRTRR